MSNSNPGSAGPTPNESVLDQLADVFVYAPVGLALQLKKLLPELIESGHRHLDAPLGAAKVVGRMTVDQQRRDLAERLRTATEPYFGGSTPPPTPAGGQTEPATAPGPDSHGDDPSPEPVDAQGSPATAPVASGDTSTSSFQRSADTGDGHLAIPGYASLAASQILEHLDGLSNEELAAIADYEAANRRRASVMSRIDTLRSPSS